MLFAAHKEDGQAWAPVFAIVGLVGLLMGLHMSWTWPIPDLSKVSSVLPNLKFANAAFGEMTVLFAVPFLAAAVSLAKKWSLLPISIYALVAGAIAIVIGVRLWNLWLTKEPMMTGIGFILTGSGGVLAGPFLWLRRSLVVRIIAALLLLAAAAIWAFTAVAGYWDHLRSFSTWHG